MFELDIMILKTNSTVQRLRNTLPQHGKVTWIGLRSARREPMTSVEQVGVSPDGGLIGDRYQGRSGHRQVTLVQAEHLVVIANFMGLAEIPPGFLRRNIVVKGINLLALREKEVEIGNARIEITGLCHPCSRMEEILGDGGYNAVRGHGGVTARVLTCGHIAIGDLVCLPATVSKTL